MFIYKGLWRVEKSNFLDQLLGVCSRCVTVPAGRPRIRFESGFISDLGLSTFGPSTLHFLHFSISFQLLPQGVGQILVQAKNFRKKFRSVPIPHLRVPFKHE